MISIKLIVEIDDGSLAKMGVARVRYNTVCVILVTSFVVGK